MKKLLVVTAGVVLLGAMAYAGGNVEPPADDAPALGLIGGMLAVMLSGAFALISKK